MDDPKATVLVVAISLDRVIGQAKSALNYHEMTQPAMYVYRTVLYAA